MELQLCWSGAVERGFWHIRMDTIPVSTFNFEYTRGIEYRYMSYRHCCFYASSNSSGNQRDPLRGVMLAMSQLPCIDLQG